MTATAQQLRARIRTTLSRFVTHPATLWGAFVVVHLVLGLICLTSPSLPMGDVTLTYSRWVRLGVDTGTWVGVTAPGVYPALALVPMVAAVAFGWTFYASTWVSLAMAAHAVAFAVILHRGGRGRLTTGAAWWWLGFLAALGPVALGRIDTFATAISIVAVLVIIGRPALGAALLTIGAWIKVWPAALVAAALIALRARLSVALAASLTTLAVLVGGLIVGGGPQLFSFITQQNGRGLQIEAPLATVAMWTAWAGGPTAVYYDRGILTYQLLGAGVDTAAALSTPLLVLSVAGIVALGVAATIRGARAARLLPPLVLAFTVALILFNKVGSPQFAGWLAVPVVLGLVSAQLAGETSHRIPAVLALATAALTHAIYPYAYGMLLRLDTGILLVLTVRNILYAVLFVWAIGALIDVVRRPRTREGADSLVR